MGSLAATSFEKPLCSAPAIQCTWIPLLSGGPKGGGGPLCPHHRLQPLLVKGDVSAGWSPPPGELKAKESVAWLPSLRETLPQPDGPHTPEPLPLDTSGNGRWSSGVNAHPPLPCVTAGLHPLPCLKMLSRATWGPKPGSSV